MKKIITLLLLLPSLVMAQLTTINPDTVCYQTNGSVYQVDNTLGYTYNWTVTPPGVITSGPNTNQITVDWSGANPGLIINAVQVQATNSIGCTSPLVTLDVFIYNVDPVLTNLPDMCEGGNCVTLTGTPTGGIWSGPGVDAINNEFCPTNSGAGTFNLTYTYTNANCVFTEAMSVNVLPIPLLLPIEHN